MNYYELFILGSALGPLTYESNLVLKKGDVLEVPFQGKTKLAVVINSCEKPTFDCKKILKQQDSFFTQTQLEIAKFISNYYVCSQGISLSLMTPAKYTKFEVSKLSLNTPSLDENQEKAFDFIEQNKVSLLFGDTGSGKTEIYIMSIAKTLQDGKSAIFLLPEIGLTPQLETRLKSYFGDLVSVWHSKLTPKKRLEVMQRLNDGKVRILLGARSALFLPLEKVGLIVVDEEHDESYKSAKSPRYNARDIAILMGKILDSKVILGSATPSVISATKVPTFRLKGNYFNTKINVCYENLNNSLSQKLLIAISKTLEKNQQIIIFLPTRAHFKYITCKSCGAHIECPFCSVAMSLHKHHNVLKCHYCNYTSPIPKVCPKCGDETMEASRLGTSEVVDRLREIFTDKNIEKFDRDEVSTETKLRAMLKSFNNHEIDILVGTQMLSKGHDYHKVGLSIIMGIDSILAISDFKSREKALSLAIQIAGRSGRKEHGEVFIQTQNEDFFKKYLQDYDAFIKDEQNIRLKLFPPYTKLLRLLIEHKNANKAQEIMQNALNLIQDNCKDVEIIGYGKADIEKISNKFRYTIVLRHVSAKSLIEAAMICKNNFIQIDMDPLHFS